MRRGGLRPRAQARAARNCSAKLVANLERVISKSSADPIGALEAKVLRHSSVVDLQPEPLPGQRAELLL